MPHLNKSGLRLSAINYKKRDQVIPLIQLHERIELEKFLIFYYGCFFFPQREEEKEKENEQRMKFNYQTPPWSSSTHTFFILGSSEDLLYSPTLSREFGDCPTISFDQEK